MDGWRLVINLVPGLTDTGAGVVVLLLMDATDGEERWTYPGLIFVVVPPELMLVDGERWGYVCGMLCGGCGGET